MIICLAARNWHHVVKITTLFQVRTVDWSLLSIYPPPSRTSSKLDYRYQNTIKCFNSQIYFRKPTSPSVTLRHHLLLMWKVACFYPQAFSETTANKKGNKNGGSWSAKRFAMAHGKRKDKIVLPCRPVASVFSMLPHASFCSSANSIYRPKKLLKQQLGDRKSFYL